MDDLGPNLEVLASSIEGSFPRRELPSRLEKEATLQVKVKDRFGIFPNFFRLTPEHAEITDNLWSFACFAYLDNPLPSLFRSGCSFTFLGSARSATVFCGISVFGWTGSRLR